MHRDNNECFLLQAQRSLRGRTALCLQHVWGTFLIPGWWSPCLFSSPSQLLAGLPTALSLVQEHMSLGSKYRVARTSKMRIPHCTFFPAFMNLKHYAKFQTYKAAEWYAEHPCTQPPTSPTPSQVCPFMSPSASPHPI